MKKKSKGERRKAKGFEGRMISITNYELRITVLQGRR